jgi:secreted trypsin-like serine protease
MTIRHLFSRLTTGLALLLALGLSACGGGSDDSSSVTATNTCANLGLVTTKSLEIAKIRNGTGCDVNNASPVVMLWVTTADGRRGICSGTMITTHTVLTAGHCLDGRIAVDVAYGSSGGGFLVQRASSFMAHPDYSYTDSHLVNDVGIVYLPAPVATATLPILVSVTPKVGDLTSIYGYGLTGANSYDSGVLRSGSSLVSGVTDQKIISVYDGNRSNTCSGDSGGPMVLPAGGLQGIIGVTSSGTTENCDVGDWSSYSKLQNSSIQNFLRMAAPDARFI